VCHEEADGIGDAEPYLWPVFFKVDGDSYAVDNVGLIGFPTIIDTNGKHGNLNDDDVGENDQVFVPAAVGNQTVLLKPIPINDPVLRSLLGTDDLPGIAGVVFVLMEEDGWPDDFATTGYNALIEAVRLGVAKAVASFQHASATPTDDEIDEQIADVKTLAAKMVKGLILEHMTGGQIGGFGTVRNNDDQIGMDIWRVDQDEFARLNSRGFQSDFNNSDGKWTVKGTFTNLDGPPPDVDPARCALIAGQIASLLEELQGTDDVNEAKRIRTAIATLRTQAKQLGCPS
jgi:hypothetical protein